MRTNTILGDNDSRSPEGHVAEKLSELLMGLCGTVWVLYGSGPPSTQGWRCCLGITWGDLTHVCHY